MKQSLLIFLLLLCGAAFAQQQQLKKANRLFDEYAFPEAAEAYRDYLKKERKPSKETVRRIADTYYFIGEYASAAQWYGKLKAMPGYTMDDKYFNRYIQSLLMDGNAKKDHIGLTDQLVTERLSSDKDKAQLLKYTMLKKQLDSVNATESPYVISNINVNSDKSDFGTAFYGDKIVYSSSKHINKVGRKIYKWNEQPMLELYMAERDTTTGELLNEQKFFPKELNNYHNATLAFTDDLKTVYFSTNTIKKNGFLDNADNGTNNLQIVKATIEEGKLVNEEKLKINKLTYSVAHPALTADGKWMFFTSDMPGGFGETDIYLAKVLDNGQLDDVKNLGPEINTTGKEMFPFVHNDVLCFSSDGHYGMGGLDVFAATILKDMKVAGLKNLGAPINSNRDDFAFIISKDEKYGYFSSNRKKGKGDDDIYYFTKKPIDCKQQLLAGTVKSNKVPVQNADVKVYDEQGKLVATLKTGIDGAYSVNVDCNRKYTIEISKPDHSTVRQEAVVGNLSVTPQDNDVVLESLESVSRKEGDEIIIDIDPIYFDLDKYNVRPDAAIELDKVVDVMKKFPSMVIRIESHTDSRQTHKYNITLSNNRAKATYNYLLSKGIVPHRIESYKGYGETRLKNRCADDVPCSEEEHQLNRRSDFVIVRR